MHNKKYLLVLFLAIFGLLVRGQNHTPQLVSQVLHRANDDEPATLDPQLAQNSAEMHILRDLFVGLMDENHQGKLIGGMAEKWRVSPDGLTYVFTLRPSQWSDGQPVKAGDFVFAWQRAVNPEVGSKFSGFLKPVKNASAIMSGQMKELNQLGVRALDDRHLQVELNQPTPYFLEMLVNPVTYPVPRHIVERYGRDWPKYLVSNGPFQLELWQPNNRIVLSRSPYYYNRAQVRLEQVVYYPIPNMETQLQLYRAGRLDFTSDIPNSKIKWIREHLGRELHTNPFWTIYYYGFNLEREPFKNNRKLRQALALAVDRVKLVEKVTGAGERPAYSFVVPGISNYLPYVPAYARLNQQRRNEMAQQLYREAGFSREKPVKFELLFNENDNNRRIVQAITAMWQEVLGVDVELRGLEWKHYLQARRSTDSQMFRASWLADYDNASSFLDIFADGKDDSYSLLLAQAGAELDLAKRGQLLRQAEKLLLEEQRLIPLYFLVSHHLIKPEVKGFSANVMNRVYSKYMYKEETDK